MKQQPWIRSGTFDLAWIFVPIILPAVCVFLFPHYFNQQQTDLSTTSWVLLVLLVDVAHVYSTVYRTYFNKTALKQFSVVLKVAPIACWIVGVLLYSIDDLLFWRCLAYLAVFHFIRQQYGFLRIYSRKDALPKWAQVIHTISIYGAALLPVLIWHAEGRKNFNWFVEGDFIYFDLPVLASVFRILFAALILVFSFSEIFLYAKYKVFNLPRILLVSGTALSWYTGIVVFNGDLVFTMLNVIAHGIPYMALIWASEQKNTESRHFPVMRHFFKIYGIVFFAGLLFLFAWLEEGLWDSLVWQEHKSVFGAFYFLEPLKHVKLLAFVIPLLSLPQVVHYVLDGFIWKISKQGGEVELPPGTH